MLEPSWNSRSSFLSPSSLPRSPSFCSDTSAVFSSCCLVLLSYSLSKRQQKKFKDSLWEEALTSHCVFVCVCVCVVCVSVLICTCLWGFVKLNASQMNADWNSHAGPLTSSLALNFSQSVFGVCCVCQVFTLLRRNAVCFTAWVFFFFFWRSPKQYLQ